MPGCRNLKEFPNVPDSIVELELSKTGIKDIPPRIENLFRLCQLLMYGCKRLNNISPNISKLENLEVLALSISAIDGNDDDNEINNEGGVGREDGESGGADDDDVDGFFNAVIEWLPHDNGSLRGSWTLRSDFNILPICLPEKALTSLLSLRFKESDGLKTIPDCISRLSGLTKLDIRECRKLVALPQLPDSLLSLDAENCVSLKRIDCSFQNPEIRLNFANCINLNQEARELIQTSSCKYALLPGVEVPAHLTNRATSGSLTMSLTPRPLPSHFTLKAETRRRKQLLKICIFVIEILRRSHFLSKIPKRKSKNHSWYMCRR